MVKRSAFALLLCLVALETHARYVADPRVRYRIDARLDANAKTIQGREIIVWKNHTTDAVPDLQFHLYLNAFKNNMSTYMRERGATGGTGEINGDAWGRRSEDWGYQEVRSIKVEGEDLTSRMHYIQPDDGNPHDQTVLRVALSRPVRPNQSVSIEIDWISKRPRLLSRTGYHDNFFFVAQWFPKPGVYEAKGERHRQQGGWNTRQFHASTEFYADYGSFEVLLTVPSNFELASSGKQQFKRDNPNGTTTYK
jgi:hypothetical protein